MQVQSRESRLAKKRKRWANADAVDMRFMGEEPEIEHVGKENDLEFGRALSWYNYFGGCKEAKKLIVEYVRETRGKVAADAINSLRDSSVVPTSAWTIKMIQNGTTFEPEYIDRLNARIQEMIDRAEVPDPDEEAPVEKKIDRGSTKHRLILIKVEEEIDEFLDGYESNFSIYEYLTAEGAATNTIGYLTSYFQKLHDEMVDHKDDFSELGRRSYRKMVEWYAKMVEELGRFQQNKQAVRKPRAKKTVTVEKKLGNFKYAPRFDPLKLVSQDPSGIPGASEVWLFSHKDNKIFRLQAEDGKSLDINGSAIVNVDVKKSTYKTVKKPEETLKKFFECGKVSLRTFMSTIPTKEYETAPAIRTGMETIILKILK